MRTDVWICKRCGYGPSEHYFGWNGGCVWTPKEPVPVPGEEELNP